jgi:hypothetical protein
MARVDCDVDVDNVVMDELERALIEQTGDQLHAKITSKFQTSSFLAGFAVAVLGVLLAMLSNTSRPRLFSLSIALLFAAVLVYVAALIKLDELTMPKRFWSKPPSKHPVPPKDLKNYELVRLDDDDLFELRRRMVFYWYGLTITATGMTGAALVLLLVPSATEQTTVANDWSIFRLVLEVLGASVIYVLVMAYINRRLTPEGKDLVLGPD